MKNKKIILLLSVIILILILIGSFFIVRGINKGKRIEEIKDYMNSSYEKLKNNGSIKYFKNQEVTFSLEDLKTMRFNTEEYEKNKCDFDKSKVTLKFDEDADYTVEVKLSCLFY